MDKLSSGAASGTDSLNSDPGRPVRILIANQQWEPSPSPGVERKRLHRSGGLEDGQVTSIVRYLPGSRFSAHDHPQGEEILVLDGVFSDASGDWSSGSYLLNPEGFRHAPYSDQGCLLFVKLRQYAGSRQTLRLSTDAEFWSPSPVPEISEKQLYTHPQFSDRMRIECWQPGTRLARRHYPDGVEILVIQGGLEDEFGAYPALSWLRLPAGFEHCPGSREGCELYIKEGGFEVLRT